MRAARQSGFAGERIRVLPRRRAEQSLTSPVTQQILVTDCGYFPAAAAHRRSRPHGSRQAIVIICTEGRGWCELDGARYLISPGEALVIPPGVPHVYGSDDNAAWTVWWLHVAGSDIDSLVEAIGDRPVVPVPRLAHCVALVNEAIEAMETDESPASLTAASGAAWHLLALIASGRHQPQLGRPDPVALATAILQQELRRRVPVPELAERVGLSPSHLSALFRRQVGCGPAEYHSRLRMSAARELLDTTTDTVASIARQVGFSDAFYFARQFRAAHDMTPSAYRVRDIG